jgi:hypothetical protein
VNRPRTVVVLTFPRSGSSLLAGIIHRLGVPMGSDHDLARGRHLNRHGCHEDQEMQRISLNLLFEAGLLLDLTRRLDLDEGRLERAARRWDRAMARFVDRHAGSTWGFKDPSFLYSAPYLEHHLRGPRYVVLTRSADATARSLYTTFRARTWLPELRQKLPLFTWPNRLRLVPHALGLRLRRAAAYHEPGLFQRVVEAGHRRIEAFVSGRDHLDCTLESIVASPRETVDRLVDFLGLDPHPEAVAAALAFVEPDLLRAGSAPAVPGCDAAPAPRRRGRSGPGAHAADLGQNIQPMPRPITSKRGVLSARSKSCH